MEHFVITIARGFGSGGKVIATKVAKELGIDCYENRILSYASQLSGYDENEFVQVNERLRGNALVNGLRMLPVLNRPRPEKKRFTSDEKLFEYQKRIILELADKESCVIVGKCADFILKDRKNVLSVYIEAPREHCRKRVEERMLVSGMTADKMIEETDKYRADYYKYYTGGNYWTNPVNYDLTVNPARIGEENCVRLIADALKMKLEGDGKR